MVLADEFDEGQWVRLPVLGKALQVFKNRGEARTGENRHGVFGVLVEVRVEDALIHEVGFALDWKQQPTEIVQLEHGENVRLTGDRLLDGAGMLVEGFLAA